MVELMGRPSQQDADPAECIYSKSPPSRCRARSGSRNCGSRGSCGGSRRGQRGASRGSTPLGIGVQFCNNTSGFQQCSEAVASDGLDMCKNERPNTAPTESQVGNLGPLQSEPFSETGVRFNVEITRCLDNDRQIKDNRTTKAHSREAASPSRKTRLRSTDRGPILPGSLGSDMLEEPKKKPVSEPQNDDTIDAAPPPEVEDALVCMRASMIINDFEELNSEEELDTNVPEQGCEPSAPTGQGPMHCDSSLQDEVGSSHSHDGDDDDEERLRVWCGRCGTAPALASRNRFPDSDLGAALDSSCKHLVAGTSLTADRNAFHTAQQKHWTQHLEEIQLPELPERSVFSCDPHPNFKHLSRSEISRLEVTLFHHRVKDPLICAKAELLRAWEGEQHAQQQSLREDLEAAALRIIVKKGRARPQSDVKFFMNFLKTCDYFRDLSTSILHTASFYFCVRRFEEGDIITRETERTTGIFVIMKGRVCLEVTNSAHSNSARLQRTRRQVIGAEELQDSFSKRTYGGGQATGKLSNSYTSSAETPVETLFIPAANILMVLEEEARQERIAALAELFPPTKGKAATDFLEPSKVVRSNQPVVLHELFVVKEFPRYYTFQHLGEKPCLEDAVITTILSGTVQLKGNGNVTLLGTGAVLGEEPLKNDVFQQTAWCHSSTVRVMMISALDYVTHFRSRSIYPYGRADAQPSPDVTDSSAHPAETRPRRVRIARIKTAAANSASFSSGSPGADVRQLADALKRPMKFKEDLRLLCQQEWKLLQTLKPLGQRDSSEPRGVLKQRDTVQSLSSLDGMVFPTKTLMQSSRPATVGSTKVPTTANSSAVANSVKPQSALSDLRPATTPAQHKGIDFIELVHRVEEPMEQDQPNGLVLREGAILQEAAGIHVPKMPPILGLPTKKSNGHRHRKFRLCRSLIKHKDVEIDASSLHTIRSAHPQPNIALVRLPACQGEIREFHRPMGWLRNPKRACPSIASSSKPEYDNNDAGNYLEALISVHLQSPPGLRTR